MKVDNYCENFPNFGMIFSDTKLMTEDYWNDQ